MKRTIPLTLGATVLTFMISACATNRTVTDDATTGTGGATTTGTTGSATTGGSDETTGGTGGGMASTGGTTPGGTTPGSTTPPPADSDNPVEQAARQPSESTTDSQRKD